LKGCLLRADEEEIKALRKSILGGVIERLWS
jgi:hypothetical protein